MPEDVFRFGALMSLIAGGLLPGLDPGRLSGARRPRLAIWFLGIPLGIWANRRAPAGTAEYFD